MVLVNSVGVSSRKDAISGLYSFNGFIAYSECGFYYVFSMASYGVTKELSIYWRGGLFLWDNISFRIKADFISLDMAWPAAIDPVSLILVKGDILIALNGFSGVSIPLVPFYSSLLLDRVTRLVCTISFSTSKSYWITLEISSEVWTLNMKNSPPISVILVLI